MGDQDSERANMAAVSSHTVLARVTTVQAPGSIVLDIFRRVDCTVLCTVYTVLYSKLYTVHFTVHIESVRIQDGAYYLYPEVDQE
jgi:hypothetical protein